MQNTSQKKLLEEFFQVALTAVDPYESVKRYTDTITSVYRSCHCEKILVIGFGKASCRMVEALEDTVGDLIEEAIVITKYGHCEDLHVSEKMRIFEAGHPVPDENGKRGTEAVLRLLGNSPEKRLIVCLISGGGSALLVSPSEGITLNEKQKLTDMLLKAGVDINGLNTVRKHVSRVKGGRLAEIAYPAHIVSLILSDVIGDSLDVIASGPTSPDTTTYNDALQILDAYRLRDEVPPSVIDILERGSKGIIPETPKATSKIFEHTENIIIGSNRMALTAIKEEAEKRGCTGEILSYELSGEAKDMGRWLARTAREIKNANPVQRARCFISGGETTVTVTGKGVGGRNMELALSFAMEIEGTDGIALISAGTDGTDGPTDAAGAIVDGQTVIRARSLGLDPVTYMNNNDSYNFFKEINELFITGPTGTNVMDIQIMVLT
jgi:glycerate-2-kinase